MALFFVVGISVTAAIEGFHRTKGHLGRTALALQRSELRFRTLAATVPETLFTAMPDGTWDYVSERFCDYTGLSPEKARAGWMDAIHPEDRKLAEEKWAAAVATGAGFEVTFRIRGSNGEYRWFEAHAKPLREPDGAISK